MAKQGALPAGMQNGLGELWSRIRFVLLAIVVYRIGTHIPVPGINPDALARLFEQNQAEKPGQLRHPQPESVRADELQQRTEPYVK